MNSPDTGPLLSGMRSMHEVLQQELRNGEFNSVLNQIELGFGAAFNACAPLDVLQSWQHMAVDLAEAAQTSSTIDSETAVAIENFTGKLRRIVNMEKRVPVVQIVSQPTYQMTLKALREPKTVEMVTVTEGRDDPEAHTQRHDMSSTLMVLLNLQLIGRDDRGFYHVNTRGKTVLAQVEAAENGRLR